MTAANALAWFAQIAVVVGVCAGMPRALRLRSAGAQHVFWRGVLTLCLLLPVLQPWQPHEMAFAPAPAAVAPVAARMTPAAAAAPVNPPVDWLALAAKVAAAGIVVRLAWLALGLARLRRIRRAAGEPAIGFDDLRQATAAGEVPIFWSRETTHPVTFGTLKPVVLLPMAIKSVDLAAQRAVVAHELHHVNRHDWLWTMGEEILRAVFWFHPAMWWLISRVQLARETVVDELSILTTNARRAYLDTLLAFADDTGLRSTTAFSARRHLFHRVMLLSKEGTMSSTRVAVASCLLAVALAAGAWTAVSAFPLHVGSGARQLPAAAATPDTAESHHLIATHYWEIVNKDTSLTPQERLAEIAKGIAAEDRAITIDPNYIPALVYKNIFLRLQANLTADPSARERLIVEADALRQTVIVLRGNTTPSPAARGSMPPPPPPAPPSGAEMAFMPADFDRLATELNPVRVGPDVKPPVKIRDVKPVYPPVAQEAHVQGVVVVETLIGTDGSIADARILRSIPLLDQAALEAVRQWRFTPTVIAGTPQAVRMTVTVNFSLQ